MKFFMWRRDACACEKRCVAARSRGMCKIPRKAHLSRFQACTQMFYIFQLHIWPVSSRSWSTNLQVHQFSSMLAHLVEQHFKLRVCNNTRKRKRRENILMKRKKIYVHWLHKQKLNPTKFFLFIVNYTNLQTKILNFTYFWDFWVYEVSPKVLYSVQF